MAALRSVLSRQTVNKFCKVGAELLNGPICLSPYRWETALDAVEKAKSDPSLLPPVASLPISAVTEAIRHYHGLYTRCTQVIVVPFQRWKQWHDGLHFFKGESTKEGTETLIALCCQLLASQQERFAVVFWGCWSSVAIRLDSLLLHVSLCRKLKVDDSVNGENGDEETFFGDKENNIDGNVDHSISRLRKLYFSELYQFQRLAHDAAHLFNFYGSVGKSERQWLSEILLLEHNEKAAEALIRFSFKRDFGVPCVDLENGVLLEEYKSFEVNDAKEKLLQKRAYDTLKGIWCSKARNAFEFEMLQKLGSLQNHVNDNHGNELLDELVECLHQKADRPDLALAVTMQRILEKESFPASVDSARLEFALGLLLQWFEAYSAERNCREIPLFLKEDLWTFLLERHTELLKWAVFYYCRDDAKVDLSCALECVRTVTFSVRRCLEVYIANIVSRRFSEDVKKRLNQQAKQKACEWIQRTALSTFLDGIQHISSERADAVEDTNTSFSVALFTTRIAVVKSQLMLLFDASLLAMDARRELLPIVNIGFEQMNVLRGYDDISMLSNWTMCMVTALNTLRRTISHSADSSGGSDDLVATLHLHYRALQQLSPISMVDFVSDAWIDFLSSEGKYSLGSRLVKLIDVSCTRRQAMITSHHIEEEGVKDTQQKRPRKE